MSYIRQTFSSNQVFTDANASQIESNIRDHIHGVDGVGPSGISWAVASATASFAVVNSMATLNYQLSGDITATFAAAATLGQSFGIGMTNIGSGRVVLAAATGQFIGTSSIFALTPGANVSVWSDGAKLHLFGQTTGQFLLYKDISVNSRALSAPIQLPFINDFDHFILKIGPSQINSHASNNTRIVMQLSVDSGVSFITSAYEMIFNNQTVSAASSGLVVFSSTLFAGIGSPQVFSCEFKFTKGPWLSGSQSTFMSWSQSGVRANSNSSFVSLMSSFATTSATALLANSVNSFRLLGSTTAFFANRVISIWGVR